MVGCPADTCEFDGSTLEVTAHIAESDDEGHTWEVLGYEDTDGFRHDTHLEEGQRLQKIAQEARDHGKFGVAIEELEGALHHFQRAKLFADDASSIENRCREVLRTIDEIETAEQVQVINDLVDQAENAIDTGDKAHLEGDPDLAGQKYKEATDALEEARTVATELEPTQVSGIDRHLRRVRVRQQSIELSEVHQPIRELVADARDHAAAGDRAFQKSKYEVALNEYKKARERYESLEGSLEQFSFDESIADPKVCDVCRHRFEEELGSWRINLSVSLQVCPACAQFGSDGNLPSPQDVAAEQGAVKKNIESIRDGEIGLTWTSDDPLQSDAGDESNSGTTERDTQQMIMQLVGLCQQLRRKPFAEELDEHTDFGYLAYRDEFGSITEALQAAGFDS